MANKDTNYPQGNRGLGPDGLKQRLAQADQQRQRRLQQIRAPKRGK